MDKKEVTIIFKSKMYDTDEKFDISAKGMHYIKDGKHYVTYSEVTQDGRNVRNILKFDSEALHVSKIGITRTNMYYKKGHIYEDVYGTPFGVYDMCIRTTECILSETKDTCKIMTEYNLELGGQHVSKCRVEITIR